MDKFIASAYLPYGQRFEEHVIEANHSWVAKLDLATREAVIINYHLIHSWLAQAYPLLFADASQQNSDAPEAGKKKRPYDSEFWLKVLDGITGDDIVNQDNYARLSLHVVLRFLTERIKKYSKS